MPRDDPDEEGQRSRQKTKEEEVNSTGPEEIEGVLWFVDSRGPARRDNKEEGPSNEEGEKRTYRGLVGTVRELDLIQWDKSVLR